MRPCWDVCVSVSAYDGRQDIDVLSFAEPNSLFRRDLQNARDSTAEHCGTAGRPCDQALTADGLTVMRFPNKDDARTAAEALGPNGYWSGYIAVVFVPGFLAPDLRLQFEGGLDGLHTSE